MQSRLEMTKDGVEHINIIAGGAKATVLTIDPAAAAGWLLSVSGDWLKMYARLEQLNDLPDE